MDINTKHLNKNQQLKETIKMLKLEIKKLKQTIKQVKRELKKGDK